MRWKCLCEYDGTSYVGWQKQINGSTIQGTIEHRLNTIFGNAVCIYGSGRTDKGVHAKGQIFHFDANWNHSHECLMHAINSGLPKDILIRSTVHVKDTFHSRYSVICKCYLYRIYLGHASPWDNRYCWSLDVHNLDLKIMHEAASYFIGRHNFSAFSAMSRDKHRSVCNFTKYIKTCEIQEQGRWITIRIEGNGYLYKMVRSMVGALVQVGRRRMNPIRIKQLLQLKKRTSQIVSAPAQGLTLEYVHYDS